MRDKTREFRSMLGCCLIASVGTIAFLILFIDSLPGKNIMDSAETYEYWQGVNDSKQGFPQLSYDPDYVRGYGNQYAQEQQLTAQGDNNEPR